MNEWSLITGASSGIGRELANCFAADGSNVVLVARNKERLNQIADSLRSEYRIKVRVLVKDLSVAGTPNEIAQELSDSMTLRAGQGWSW